MLFLRGYIVECFSWDLRQAKHTKTYQFLIEEEFVEYKDSLAKDNYQNHTDGLFYRLADGWFKVVIVKSKIPKTYVYRDNEGKGEVLYFGSYIPIARQFKNEILPLLDLLISANVSEEKAN